MLTNFKLKIVNLKMFEDTFPSSSNVQTINTTIEKRQNQAATRPNTKICALIY